MRLRPGKPTWFGVRGGTLAFGLPGNPVSAMVTFQLFVAARARRAPGRRPRAAARPPPWTRPFARNPQREQAVRVRLRLGDHGLAATPTGRAGLAPADLDAGRRRAGADPPGEGELAAGERVEVELL